jgi:hypothetical protein
MTLKVIGAGFGRTGTLSLKGALEMLGYVKTHHMAEVLPSKVQVGLWHDIAMGKKPAWDAIFDGYQASVDFPSSGYYRELLAEYPDAKVVLTVRDVDSWYRSATDTIFAFGHAVPAWLKFFVPRVRRALEMVDACVWQRVFQGRFADETYAKQVFVDHIEAVKTHVPVDQLLIFEVKEGWQPLCQFLGCQVPDAEFPNLNDTNEFNRRVRILRIVSVLPLVLVGLALAALVF